MNIGELAKFRGGIATDTISEVTSASGVTIDGVILKDNKVTASSGITFGDETLANYDEGTWTPTVEGTATAGTATYAVNGQVGIYTRVGRLVTLHGYVSITNHTGTGNIRIGGLPFQANATTNVYAHSACLDIANLTVPANSMAYAIISPGTSVIAPYSQATGGGTGAGLAMDTAFSIWFTITYTV